MVTQIAYLVFVSVSYVILADLRKQDYAGIKEQNQSLFDGLEKVGVRLNRGTYGSVFFMKCLRSGSYCIDIGDCQLITDFEFNLAHGQWAEVVEDGLIPENVTRPEACLIGCDIGYGSMNR